MVKEYKSLYITNESEKAEKARNEGKYVVLCLPMDKDMEMNLSEFPYAVQQIEELTEDYLDKLICRFEGRPCNILTTDRCLVREISLSDVDKLYEIYKEPCITEYMEDLYQDPDEERAYTRDYIKYQYGIYDYGVWIIEDKFSHTVIGRAGFSIREGYELPELGYMVRMEYQRKGYATEVCSALLSYAKEELDFKKVGAFTDQSNEPSRQLLRTLGFCYKGEEVLKVVSGKCKDSKKMQYYVLTI